ncbi:hypothetical protein [Gilvimarinus agarilyticus]|uniref:hypothetical protein n=1 Tax=Gilvimarinus agarilyticus TaxID=679259 RepID=UPI0005A114ED|nr:hypothetical protein [Gilvimarinus agarilyticus]
MIKYCLLLTFCFFCSSVFGCGDDKIPISVVNSYDKIPTDDKRVEMLIVAPLEFEGFELNSAELFVGESMTVMHKFTDFDEYPSSGVYIVVGTLPFLKNSYASVTYVNKAVADGNGNVVFSPCLHNQRVDWGYNK